MGSLCCVAARPQGSNATNREWPMGPHEPYWRTNTSFSPPPSRWDYGLQSGVHYGSNDSIQFGSTSSNSKESRCWIRGGYHPTHQYSASDGGVLFLSSPSDASLIQSWTPPPVRGARIDDFEPSARRDTISGPLSFTPTMEGTSMVQDCGDLNSPHSDESDFEHTRKLNLSTSRNFPSRRSFMSKPIHPLSYPIHSLAREVTDSSAARHSSFNTPTPQTDTHRLSSGSSSIDLIDISEQFLPEFHARSLNVSESYKCGLCEKLLSQRSPWSSRRIVKSEDMPVAGILSCRHVFHAECLEQTTPKSHKSDPPCPICSKLERGNSSEQHAFPRLRNFPRLRDFSGEGTSRSWSCVQAGDCVEGALHTQKSSKLLLNRQNIKRSISDKDNSGNDFRNKLKKTSSYPMHLFGGRFNDHSGGGCSKSAAGPS